MTVVKIWVLVNLFVLALSFGLPARGADDPRAIDFRQVLTTADGQPFKSCQERKSPAPDAECVKYIDYTLGALVLQALSIPDQRLAPDEVARRGELGLKLYTAAGVVVPAKDITTIKEAISKLGVNNILAYRAFQLLEPPEKKD